jgi:hypothetical protein
VKGSMNPTDGHVNKRTCYIDLSADGGLRMTIKEAQALVSLSDYFQSSFDEAAGRATGNAALRAVAKLRVAIAQSPYIDCNKRAVPLGKRNEA